MAIVAGDVLRATATTVMPDGVSAQNIWHFVANAGVSATEASVVGAIAARIDAAMANLNSIVDADCSVGAIEVSKRNPTTGDWDAIGTGTFSTYNPSAAGDMLPHGCAAIVRFTTLGKGEQGRKFIAGLTEAQQVDSNLGAGAVTALINFGAAAIISDSVSGGTISPGWWSEVNTAFRPYASVFVINAILGYQRRRKPGVGI